MKRIFTVMAGIMLMALLTGCWAGKETETVSLFSSEKTVGKDIPVGDVTDFYYTEESINYDAYYQRYHFYVEDGKYMFFHETRERKDDYGPCTEEDVTLIGTVELTDDQWSRFIDLVSGGTVKARKDSAESGGTGPWLYLYWTNDGGKYRQFSFDGHDAQAKFEEFCVSLALEASGE